MTSNQRRQLEQRVSHVQWHVDMGIHSTFKVGGRVDALVKVKTRGELASFLVWAEAEGISWTILGGGSNILVVTRHVKGMFFQLGDRFTEIQVAGKRETAGNIFVSVGAGCRLGKLVSFCSQKSLTGMEWATGIPGTVGGAIRMNAGAHGSQMADIVHSVMLMDHTGQEWEVPAEEITFGYRTTCLPRESAGQRYVITGCTLQLTSGEAQQVQQRCREYAHWRKLHQPGGSGSAGSFFKNPKDDSAGRLIEAVGLKGFQLGGAKISDKHANFIINNGGAVPQDIINLMELIQEKVETEIGVQLEPEVHIY